MVSVFLLGRHLLGTEAAGLLAAVLLSTAPFVVFSLTNFQLDLPLTGMVALSLYLLIRTVGFSRTGWSLAFGIAAGLGMLTKPPFAVHPLPAHLWVVWQSAWSGTASSRWGRGPPPGTCARGYRSSNRPPLLAPCRPPSAGS